jgi:hypothetical protein
LFLLKLSLSLSLLLLSLSYEIPRDSNFGVYYCRTCVFYYTVLQYVTYLQSCARGGRRIVYPTNLIQ